MGISPQLKNLLHEMEECGLVVVHKKELLDGSAAAKLDLKRLQREYMRKDALTSGEIIKANLLPAFTTFNGLKKTKKFRGYEKFMSKSGRHMFCTSGIERLREHYQLPKIEV